MVNDDPLFGAYEKRVLVFMENDDYAGFSQVLLNEKQFKKVSDAIIRASKKDSSLKPGYDLAIIMLDEDRIIPGELFDGMNTINNEID